MELRRGHLLYFVTVAEEGQITRAAHKLHLAQPALSQAIAQLESDLGVELLQRHARGVTLTAAGRAFLVKARVALAAWTDAVATAHSLAGALPGTIEFGFLGSPPGLDSPGPLEDFAADHPHIDIRYRALPFPTRPTAAWLADVDLAVCHRPLVEPGLWSRVLRREDRVVLAPCRHPLAGRDELTVADVLDQTFVGMHDAVESGWAGFWSLDEERGGPPQRITPDQVANPQELLASLAVRNAIATVPATVARRLAGVLGEIVVVPLIDAAPATIVLVGRDDRRTPQVAALLAFADARLTAR